MKQFLFALLLGLACSSPKPDPDIWQPPPGEKPSAIPGPLKHFGPFDSPGDALQAACPRLLSKPNASISHLLGTARNLSEVDPERRRMLLRAATEYCAWLYYTPDHKYKLSMISNIEDPGDDLNETATCYLPTNVDDPDFPLDSIKYIFSIHNHGFASGISDKDIYLAAAMANAHAVVNKIDGRPVPYSVIAFFSHSRDGGNPSCDGFYQYIPGTREMFRWVNSGGNWMRTKTGTVHWTSPTTFIIEGQSK